MRFHMNRKKMILSLLCIMLCVCFTACAGQTGSEDTSDVLHAKKIDVSIPDEITMEFFGVNLLEVNRPIWEEHVFSLNELSEDDYIYTTFPIGDYEVMHSYLNFENKRNFSSYVTYNNDRSGSAQVLFDENDNLSKIDIRSNMSKEFCTSFLNIGDNVKDYLESLKKGLWDKFLDGETMVVEQGWYIRHSTTATSDYTYDVLQVSNNDIHISYFIKDELVDYIMLTVVGDLSLNSSFETEPSIYYLNEFDYFLNGTDIATMSASEWLNFFNFSEADEQQLKFKEQWMTLLDFSDEHFKKEKFQRDCFTVLAGEELGALCNYYEDREYKGMNLSLYPVTKVETPLGDDYIINDTDKRPSGIDFSVSKGGSFNIGLYITDEFPMITGNCIMPGDNIKTFLNSYEDGLYEKIVSLPNPGDEYCIGPYYFRFYRDPEYTGGIISIGKYDERSILPIAFFCEGETVRMVERYYRGTITGFEEELSLW